LENERLPPTREIRDAKLKEETDIKIRNAVQEEDDKLKEVADIIMEEV
jgi:serine/threonine-protein phosphatase 2B catalytic subunit